MTTRGYGAESPPTRGVGPCRWCGLTTLLHSPSLSPECPACAEIWWRMKSRTEAARKMLAEIAPLPPLPARGTASEVGPILHDVYHEINRARDKFPPFFSPHEGYAIVKEELEEAWDEIKANNLGAARAEMVQVAAMAARFLLEVHSYPVDRLSGPDREE